MKSSASIRGFLVPIMTATLLAGCTASHSNLTPPELPYYPPTGQDALVRLKSGAQVASVRAGLHALWLDVGSPLFARRNSIRAWVLIGGNEIEMTEIDSGKIIYEHIAPECGGAIDFSFRTENLSVFGARVFESTSGPYVAAVPQEGSWGWWSPINSAPTDDNWTLLLVGSEAGEVLIRNYGDSTLNLLSLVITAPGIRGFTIVDPPALPTSLSCGETATFNIRWNGDFRVPEDLGALQMQYLISGGTVQSRVITLRAVPSPG